MPRARGMGPLVDLLHPQHRVRRYLDTTFCYNFHRLAELGFDVIVIMRIACFVIFSISGVALELFCLLQVAS